MMLTVSGSECRIAWHQFTAGVDSCVPLCRVPDPRAVHEAGYRWPRALRPPVPAEDWKGLWESERAGNEAGQRDDCWERLRHADHLLVRCSTSPHFFWQLSSVTCRRYWAVGWVAAFSVKNRQEVTAGSCQAKERPCTMQAVRTCRVVCCGGVISCVVNTAV